MISRSIVIVIFLCSCSLVSFGQGLFKVKNFDPKTYSLHRQNWAVAQDDNGYLFFGNTGGLIRFDGQKWKSKHAAEGEIVRSLHKFDRHIYWGGNADLGVISNDSLFSFSAKSLKNRINQNYREFYDIWQIIEYENSLFYRTSDLIFKISDDTVNVLDTEKPFRSLFKVKNKLLVQIADEGLAWISGKKFVPIPHSENYANDRIYSVLPFGNQQLLISREQGLVLFDGSRFREFKTDVTDYIKRHKVYRAIYINSDQIAIATLTGGIVIMDTTGSIHSILTKDSGLPTNIIYELYLDREQTLWAATDNGLSKILANNPLTKLDERSGFTGIPTFIESINSTTYFGSTEGLFYSDTLGIVKKIPNGGSRVYDGLLMGDNLIVATSDGVADISGKRFDFISSSQYRVLALKETGLSSIFAADLDTIYEISITENKTTETPITSLQGHIQDLYVQKDELWVTTYKQGVFRYSLDGTLIRSYNISASENDDLHQLAELEGNLRLGTDAGLFRYHAQRDSFIVDTTFNTSMAGKQVNAFRQCKQQEIWFRNNRKIKRAVFDSGQWQIIKAPYNLIDEGETITIIQCGKDDNVWFGGTAGIFHLDDPNWKYDWQFNTNITELLVHNDSLIYGGYGNPDSPIELPYTNNELRFTYAATSYIAPDQNKYRVRLRGYNNDWSNWTSETEKDYTFIPEGTYTFEVQSKNVYQKLGTVDSFTFTILPPWYRTIWAYGLYLLVIGGILYGLHRLRINRILREQRIRNRIASDLHDEVSASLSSITYFAEAIRQVQNGGNSSRFVELISESASEAKEKITDIIWSIDPDNDDWVDLLSKCRRFASDLFESKNMDYELHIDTDIDQPLDLELRQHLWLIFKEMTVNAARHSQADKVEVRFGMNSNILKLVVQDNGIGMERSPERSGSHGIKNIKKRAQQIGADLQLETDAEIGTRWIMTLNL